MTKEHYMALPDFQSVWDDTIKPWILEQVSQGTGTAAASVATCESIVSELV